MTRTASWRHLGLLATGLVLALAACGNDGAAARPTATATQPAEQVLHSAPPGSATPDPGGEGSDGGDGGGPAPTTPPAPPAQPAGEDCSTYDAANLTVTASGDLWVLRDGGHAMLSFASYSAAQDAQRVARKWTRLCWIGRGHSGADRYRHLVEYFTHPSGLPLGPAPTTMDCVAYDPAQLHVTSVSADDDWGLFAGTSQLLSLATESDALRAKIVASGFGHLCLVGADNGEPDPYRHRMTWWRD
ncbi:MAG TPA: hypothetical protein VH561_09630 [Micromonosporaceae bacterium]